MKRKITWTLILAFLLAVGCIVIKLTVPLSYAQAKMRPPAMVYVWKLQSAGETDPEECAARYLYFNSDYHSETPERIKIRMKKISENEVRVTLYDPSCKCDSTYSSIHRIYLERKHDDKWIPVRHEWSHTGRGRFGWTTKPTT